MNRIRSVFVPIYVSYLAVVLVFVAIAFLKSLYPALSLFGLLLAVSSPLAFFCWLGLARPCLENRHFLAFSMVCGLGLAITMTMSWRFGAATGNNHVWAGLALIGWAAYLRWFKAVTSPGR